jgi:hypothetical protein
MDWAHFSWCVAGDYAARSPLGVKTRKRTWSDPYA